MSRLARWSCLVAILLISPQAWAGSLLDFDDLTFNDYDPIPSGYGSNLAGTPNIALDYRTFDPSDNSTLTPYVELWNTGYGDLKKVVFASSNGYGAEISFTPEAGYGVTLESFDMAGWFEVDRSVLYVRIVDENYNVLSLITANSIITGAGPSHSSFSPNLSHAGTIRIQWANDWNIGMDNIRFSQFRGGVVPEPSSLAAIIAGLPVLGLVVRRARRRAS